MRWLRRWSLLLALVAAQELVIGPSYTIDDAILDHGAPKSSRFEFWMPLVNSTSIFNGSDACLDPEKPPNATRHVIVDVPAAYVDGDAAPLLVMQDLGYGGETSLLEWVANARDNLEQLPAFVVVAIASGGGSERSLEYDTLSDRYARFVEREVLPAALARDDLRAAYPRFALAADARARATFGCSSGGVAALTMAFFRPDLFTRVGAYSPSAVDLQVPGQPERVAYPKGAWEYHGDDGAGGGRLLARAAPRPPLRVFVNDNEFDLGYAGNCPPWVNTTEEEFELGCWAAFDCDPPGQCCDGEHNYADAGNRTAAALAAAGYAYRHVYALDQKHCAMSNDATQNLWTETIADTLVWMWDGYEQAPGSDPNGPV